MNVFRRRFQARPRRYATFVGGVAAVVEEAANHERGFTRNVGRLLGTK